MTEADIKKAIQDISQASDLTVLEKLRLRYLGRKGEITKTLHSIGRLPIKRRARAGALANRAKQKLEQALAARKRALESDKLEQESQQPLDLTAPGGGHQLGHLHPVMQVQKELIQIFWQLGFSVAEGPEIENDWYNFEALNIPPGHPARDMQDTFYLESGAIPRTHTSSVQIRYMERHQPPIRIVAPGNVYRNEDEDATHLWAHKQIEGLVVDRGVSLTDLKGTLLHMFKSILRTDIEIDLRPSYFPYVEPALEVHVSCVVCGGKRPDCRTCKGTGWIEMLGSGMVHPQVLRNVGIDPERYSGFAFGGGLERIAMIKYGVDDVRHFWRPNLRFLEQF